VIHDNIEFQKETPGRKNEGPAPFGVYLQGHGNKVQYRNIWIKYQDQAPAAEPAVQAAVEEATPETAVADSEESTDRRSARRTSQRGGLRQRLQSVFQ